MGRVRIPPLTGTNGYSNGQTNGIFTGFFQNWYQVPLNANYTYVITMWQDPASSQGNYGAEVISVQDPANTQVYIGQSISGENLGAIVQIYFKPAMTGIYTLIVASPVQETYYLAVPFPTPNPTIDYPVSPPSPQIPFSPVPQSITAPTSGSGITLTRRELLPVHLLAMPLTTASRPVTWVRRRRRR